MNGDLYFMTRCLKQAVEDRAFLEKLFAAMYDELPEPKDRR